MTIPKSVDRFESDKLNWITVSFKVHLNGVTVLRRKRREPNAHPSEWCRITTSTDIT